MLGKSFCLLEQDSVSQVVSNEIPNYNWSTFLLYAVHVLQSQEVLSTIVQENNSNENNKFRYILIPMKEVWNSLQKYVQVTTK